MEQINSQTGRGRNRGRSTDIDKAVGVRVRFRRTELGMTQQELADKIGVTYQQLHKYETAINRVSSAMLFTIAGLLKVKIAYFFEDMPTIKAERDRDTLELIRNYRKLPADHKAMIRQNAAQLAGGVA